MTPAKIFQAVVLVLWLPLDLLVIAALLRGEYRRFPFVFVYAVVEFFITAAEVPAFLKGTVSQQSYFYNFDEVIAQVLIYLVVLSLIYRATAKLQSRRMIRALLVSGAILFAGVSFLLHYDSALMWVTWMNPIFRDLNVCSAILDLALWALLIGSREKDQRLLLISGGLGIRFTGEAIGQSLRQLAVRPRSHTLSYAGSIMVPIVDLLCLYIWWQAFRGGPAKGNRGAKK